MDPVEASLAVLDQWYATLDLYGDEPECFDHRTAVIGPLQLAAVRRILPNSWGLIVASRCDEGVSLKTVRRSKRNRNVLLVPNRVAL